MQHTKHAVVGLAALGLAVSTGLTAPVAAQPDGDHKDSKVDVHIAKNREITMPRHIRAGKNTFDIRCETNSLFQIIAPERGYSRFEFARDAHRAFNKNNSRALKRLERNVRFEGGATCSPRRGGLLWVDLDPDKYWAVDINAPRIRPGKIARFFAHDRDGDGHDGRKDGWRKGAVIRAVGHTTWAPEPRRINERGPLTFVNDSMENHFVEIAKLAKGKTERDFARWVRQVNKGEEAPPPLGRVSFDTGVVSPGESMTTVYSLPRGNYMLLCFWPDADEDNTPHVFQGMFRGIRVD